MEPAAGGRGRDDSSWSSDSSDDEDKGVLSKVGVVALDVGQWTTAAQQRDAAADEKVAVAKGGDGGTTPATHPFDVESD